MNLDGTAPTARGWRTDVNDETTSSSTFDVYAICGHAPRGYIGLGGSPVANPPHGQTSATVACPAGTVPLGGGGLSSSSSPAVDLNTTEPISGGWKVYEDNTRDVGAPSIIAYAICA